MYGDLAVAFGCCGTAVPRNSAATTRMAARVRIRFNMGSSSIRGSVAPTGRHGARAVDDGAVRARELRSVAAHDPLDRLAAAVAAVVARCDRGAAGVMRERRRAG